jgi:hypothetical protein
MCSEYVFAQPKQIGKWHKKVFPETCIKFYEHGSTEFLTGVEFFSNNYAGICVLFSVSGLPDFFGTT